MTLLLHAMMVVAVMSGGALTATTSAQPAQTIFRDPIGVAIDANGSVYVTDQLAAQVIKLTSNGTVLSRWGSQGRKLGQLNIPEGIAADNHGHVYVADTWNARIQKFSAIGVFLAAWASTPSRSFYRPLAVATDRSGNVYVTDNEDDWVWKLSPRGTPRRRLGQFGNPAQGQYRGPTAVAVAENGTVYVASYNWIYKLSPAGKTLAVWGTLRPGSVPGRFYLPEALALDAHGNVYVADTGNKRIQELSPRGAVLHVWGGNAGALRFQEPGGIAVDSHGFVFVVDIGNRRLVKLSPTGAVVAVWR